MLSFGEGGGTPVTDAKPNELQPGEARPRVLVVDDYDDGREMYAEYLTYAGYDVAMAKDGMEAIAMARDGHPDVILMDLSLPVMDGWEATRLLKADLSTRDIPVVAVTGHVMGNHPQQAADAGCDAFVAKPALPDHVERTIRSLLAASKTRLKP
jgi:two-component system, cell cycle response regulator DivK